VTPNYYIPRAIVPFQSTLIVGYYTFELVPILNPIATNSELEHNQLLIRLEQLRNLERKPSHKSGFQQLIQLVETIVAPIVVQ
jgi:hypothetical protein